MVERGREGGDVYLGWKVMGNSLSTWKCCLSWSYCNNCTDESREEYLHTDTWITSTCMYTVCT